MFNIGLKLSMEIKKNENMCKCGMEVSDDSVFCSKCGDKITSDLNYDTDDTEKLEYQSDQSIVNTKMLYEEKETCGVKETKQSRKSVYIIISILAMTVIIGYSTILHVVPFMRYNGAALDIENNEYDRAYNTYISLGNYKDSPYKVAETLYKKAVYLENQGLLLDAATVYEEIQDYQDSKEKAVYCRNEVSYRDALSMYDEGDYDAAIEMFASLGDYADSKSKINEAKYAYVKTHETRGNNTTYSYLKDLKAIGYSDAESIYGDLYNWIVAVEINNGASSVKYNKRLEVLIMIMGGEPGMSKDIRTVITYPTGEVEYGDWVTKRDLDRFTIYWDNGCVSSLSVDSPFEVKVEDGLGNILGSSSITIRSK